MTAEQLRQLPATQACARLTPAAFDSRQPGLGRAWAFAMMDRMVRAAHPLLEAQPEDRPVDRTTQLRVTETGARVLAGEVDHVAINGIDRYIGGVHLRGQHARWRWDEGTESIAGPFGDA